MSENAGIPDLVSQFESQKQSSASDLVTQHEAAQQARRQQSAAPDLVARHEATVSGNASPAGSMKSERSDAVPDTEAQMRKSLADAGAPRLRRPVPFMSGIDVPTGMPMIIGRDGPLRSREEIEELIHPSPPSVRAAPKLDWGVLLSPVFSTQVDRKNFDAQQRLLWERTKSGFRNSAFAYALRSPSNPYTGAPEGKERYFSPEYLSDEPITKGALRKISDVVTPKATLEWLALRKAVGARATNMLVSPGKVALAGKALSALESTADSIHDLHELYSMYKPFREAAASGDVDEAKEKFGEALVQGVISGRSLGDAVKDTHELSELANRIKRRNDGADDDAFIAMMRYMQAHGELPHPRTDVPAETGRGSRDIHKSPKDGGPVSPVTHSSVQLQSRSDAGRFGEPASQKQPVALPQKTAAVAGAPQPVSRSQVEKIGKRDPRSRRQVLQPSKSILNNERLAAQAAPELQRKLAGLARQLPGVELARVRPQKNPARVVSKVREGKPPETISDYLAVEIAIDSPQAGERMVDVLRRNFKVVNIDRKMGGRENKGGYASTNVQVQMPNGLTAEVQLVPREVQRASGQSHQYYVQGREARDAGNKAGARMYFKQAEKINKRALREFRERNRSE